MELINEVYKAREAGAVSPQDWNEAVEIYLKLMPPITPHIAEELWSQMDKPYSIHTQPWLSVDETSTKEDTIELPVQIKGNVCGRFTIRAKTTEDEIKSATLASETVQKFLGGKEPKKMIVANKRLVSIVVLWFKN